MAGPMAHASNLSVDAYINILLTVTVRRQSDEIIGINCIVCHICFVSYEIEYNGDWVVRQMKWNYYTHTRFTRCVAYVCVCKCLIRFAVALDGQTQSHHRQSPLFDWQRAADFLAFLSSFSFHFRFQFLLFRRYLYLSFIPLLSVSSTSPST